CLFICTTSCGDNGAAPPRDTGSTVSGTGGEGATSTGVGSSSGAGGSGGSGGHAGCAPLDAATLDKVALGFESSVELMPGQTRDFDVGVVECCYSFNPVAACATFSVEPTQGATIDPATGLLSIDAATPDGSKYTVTASIDSGKKLLQAS